MDEENLTVLDNIAVGRNLYTYRKLADLKASDVAEQLGLKEAAYTKYERGESNITIDFVLKVSKVLNVNPIFLLTVTPNNIIQSGNNSPGAILGMVYGNYHFENGLDNNQAQIIMKLMENVTLLSNKVLEMLQSKDEDK